MPAHRFFCAASLSWREKAGAERLEEGCSAEVYTPDFKPLPTNFSYSIL